MRPYWQDDAQLRLVSDVQLYNWSLKRTEKLLEAARGTPRLGVYVKELAFLPIGAPVAVVHSGILLMGSLLCHTPHLGTLHLFCPLPTQSVSL